MLFAIMSSAKAASETVLRISAVRLFRMRIILSDYDYQSVICLDLERLFIAGDTAQFVLNRSEH